MILESHASSRFPDLSAIAIARARSLACLLALNPGLARAQPPTHRFAAVDLGTLGGDLSEALAIAPNGDIAGDVSGYLGVSDKEIVAVVWIDGARQLLPPLGGPRSNAWSIAGNGDVVGKSRTGPDDVDASTSHAVL
jgi:hypothetical protein